MRCPACESNAPDGAKFCPECGAALATVAATARGVAADHTVLSSDPHATVLSDDATRAAAGSDAPYEAGTILAGRYRVERVLGRGGMGVVYLAHDERLGHPVALKFLPASLARDRRRLEQFHNEVRLARQISHPHVCRVYDIGEAGGALFLSMEYIDGEDLGAMLGGGRRFSESEGIELIRQIAAGLAAVHAQGVLHRDLKPANIMVNRAGRAQLMDFGIAAAGDAGASAGVVEGTPLYMAPEQLAGEAATQRSDIYALGLVMHEIFTGRRVRETEAGGAALDPRLPGAVRQCLDPDPARRPATAREAAGMLQTVLLDATATWRRIAQVALQAAVVPLVFGAVALLAQPGPGAKAAGAAAAAALALALLLEMRFPLGWSIAYKGHRIRFLNHPAFGERLFIDGVLADRGRVGLNVTLRGTIESGEGAGERITADVRAGVTSLSCRLVAEAFI